MTHVQTRARSLGVLGFSCCWFQIAPASQYRATAADSISGRKSAHRAQSGGSCREVPGRSKSRRPLNRRHKLNPTLPWAQQIPFIHHSRLISTFLRRTGRQRQSCIYVSQLRPDRRTWRETRLRTPLPTSSCEASEAQMLDAMRTQLFNCIGHSRPLAREASGSPKKPSGSTPKPGRSHR
jgi:hypothetical protein